MIYVAAPYTGPKDIVASRMRAVNKYCATLLKFGQGIISPLSMFHTIATEGGLPTDAATYWSINKRLMLTCDEVHVLMLPNWNRSIGVRNEIKFAKELDIQVRYIAWPLPKD